MTTNAPTLADVLAPLLNELADVQARLEPLKETEVDVKARIREALATVGPGTYEAGGHVLNAGVTRRVDVDAVAAAHPVDTHPQLYRLVPDVAAIRANLAPAELDGFMTVAGDMRIGLKS